MTISVKGPRAAPADEFLSEECGSANVVWDASQLDRRPKGQTGCGRRRTDIHGITWGRPMSSHCSNHLGLSHYSLIV